jgi:hypothetical protein
MKLHNKVGWINTTVIPSKVQAANIDGQEPGLETYAVPIGGKTSHVTSSAERVHPLKPLPQIVIALNHLRRRLDVTS